MAMANGSYVPMEVEVGESDKKAKPWQSIQKSLRTSWRSATPSSGWKSVAEARRILGILGLHDGGEELGHTEAVERSRRRFLSCILMLWLLEERTSELCVAASCDSALV
jgi:hypothetical protein